MLRQRFEREAQRRVVIAARLLDQRQIVQHRGGLVRVATGRRLVQRLLVVMFRFVEHSLAPAARAEHHECLEAALVVALVTAPRQRQRARRARFGVGVAVHAVLEMGAGGDEAGAQAIASARRAAARSARSPRSAMRDLPAGGRGDRRIEQRPGLSAAVAAVRRIASARRRDSSRARSRSAAGRRSRRPRPNAAAAPSGDGSATRAPARGRDAPRRRPGAGRRDAARADAATAARRPCAAATCRRARRAPATTPRRLRVPTRR